MTRQVRLDTSTSASPKIISGSAEALGRLTREAVLAVGSYLLATVVVWSVLHRVWEPAFAWRWFGLALLVLVFLVWTLIRNLGSNHPSGGERLYPTIGFANHVSVLRGVLLAWLAGFIFSPWPDGWLGWMPGVLYTTAIVIDYVDGIIARLTGRLSVLGQALDLELDALGILIAPALAIWWRQLPLWYGLVAVAYYAFVAGKWLRRRQGNPEYPLPRSAIRRPMAGIQMGFTSAVLWPVLDPSLVREATTLVMIPFVAGFARDWLTVSGWIDAGAPSYQRWMGQVSKVAQQWLPIVVRVTVVLVFVMLALQNGRPALYESLAPLNRVWMLVLAGLVLVGWLGRLAGTLLAIFVAIAASRWGVTPASVALIGCGLGLMLLGTGDLSLWQPEEIFLQRHYGGRT